MFENTENTGMLITERYITFKRTRRSIIKRICTQGLVALLVFSAMVILCIISLSGFFIMWCSDYYDYTILSKIVLKNNTKRAENWANPSPIYDTFLKIYIFNYSNIGEFLTGVDDKINVTDVGPLTYREHTKKVDVSFNKNFTVTYKDHRSYTFLRNASQITESTKFMVPNVPLLAAAVKIDNMYGLKKFAAIRIINNFNESPFKLISAHDLLWGYYDKIASLDITSGATRFGLLMNRNGTSADSLQINTGGDDVHKFSTIRQYNGESLLKFWSNGRCNRIDGTDATMFPPHLVKNRQRLYAFLQVLCRKIPLEYEKEVTILKNVNALRYQMPFNVFANPEVNPENECYCENTEKCMLSGVINATKCYNGAPIFPSFPHFFTGDKRLYKMFEGIHPEASKHQTFVDIHPRFAFPISGASRIQINIAVHKGPLTRGRLARLQEGVILPVIWIEITTGELMDTVLKKLYLSTFGLDAIQYALKFGTLFSSITSFCLIVFGLLYFFRKN